MEVVQSLPEKVLVDQLDPPSEFAEPPSISAEPPSVSGTVGRVVLVQSSCRLRQKILLYSWNIRILKMVITNSSDTSSNEMWR